MNILEKDIIYKVIHKRRRFYPMTCQRIDWIDGYCYLTFREEKSGKWFTFEWKEVKLIKI